MKTKKTILLVFLFVSIYIVAQNKVLVFTKTNGFTHASIGAGVTMITDLGNTNGLWTTDSSNNANVFTTTNLMQYKAVIWCNTSGDNLLDTAQKTAFENFIAQGGGFLGIHAATDTYRDGSWPFYNDLVGAIVQTGPNHTPNNFNATMTVINSHPSVDFLGTTWTKPEEYYYWQNNGGQLFTGNINILRVAATGTNSYDAARPISWYKEYAGGRSFYTALGHNASDYTSNDNFRKHIEEGIKYVIGNTLSVESQDNAVNLVIKPNPVNDILHLTIANTVESKSLSIYDSNGKFICQSEPIPALTSTYDLNVENLSKGLYLIKLTSDNNRVQDFKFIKK